MLGVGEWCQDSTPNELTSRGLPEGNKIVFAEHLMNGERLNLTKANIRSLVENGRATRFGVDWPGIRCHAKTRKGTPCLKPALKGKNRCQLHGGKSTGARTAEGLQKLRDIHFVHGQRTRKSIEDHRRFMREIKRLELLARMAGLIR